MGFTRTKANSILNDMFPCYIALSTTEPDENGGNVTEPASSTGYTRMQITVMGTASDGQISNSNGTIFFPEAESSWGTITHFALYTTQSGNTPFYTGALTSAVTVPAEYIPIFRKNSFIIGLDKDELTT